MHPSDVPAGHAMTLFKKRLGNFQTAHMISWKGMVLSLMIHAWMDLTINRERVSKLELEVCSIVFFSKTVIHVDLSGLILTLHVLHGST